MDTVLLLITAGLCAVSSHAECQYHFVYDLKTWTEAQSYCRENYTDLATVDNMEDVTTLNNMIDTSKLVNPNGWNGTWIGLDKGEALSSWKWSDGSNSSFRAWIQGQPNNYGENQRCVCADFGYSGQWRDLHCDIRIAFICYSTRLCAVSSHAERQYHFVYERKTWTEAQSYCRENYTDLATVDNMEDMTTLNNTADTSKLVHPNGWRGAWIGLYRGTYSWRWSLSDTSFYKHGETEFRRWRAGEPSNINSAEHCTAMDEDGLWNDLLCSNSLKVVCSYVRGSDVTFILITKSMTWTEAQSHCRVNYTDLTSVRNMTENQKVQELIPAGERVWIGLFRDSWKWSDGSTSLFKHWIPGYPYNYQCVAVAFTYSRVSGQWYDWPCATKLQFICYSTPTSQTTSSSTAGFSTPPHYLTTSSETQPESATTKQVFRLKFQTQDSSLDLNDPAVMEDTLKKLKQKLKDQGLGDNIKLSWRKQPGGKVFHKEEKKKKTKKDEL
ncbi:C-type mannose receptor 2-like isoform X2 [Epinephelus lanceolatus]